MQATDTHDDRSEGPRSEGPRSEGPRGEGPLPIHLGPRLTDKRVLLIGDGSETSWALAEQLAIRGADLVLIYPAVGRAQALAAQRQAQACGARCLVMAAEAVDAVAARRLMRRVVAELGRLDVYVDLTPPADTAVPAAALLAEAMRALVRGAGG